MDGFHDWTHAIGKAVGYRKKRRKATKHRRTYKR